MSTPHCKTRNAKRIRVQIIDAPEGMRSHTSLEHARRHVKRGVAEWVDGSIRFHRKPTAAQRNAELEVLRNAVIRDSNLGQTFLPYPQSRVIHYA